MSAEALNVRQGYSWPVRAAVLGAVAAEVASGGISIFHDYDDGPTIPGCDVARVSEFGKSMGSVHHRASTALFEQGVVNIDSSILTPQ